MHSQTGDLQEFLKDGFHIYTFSSEMCNWTEPNMISLRGETMADTEATDQ